MSSIEKIINHQKSLVIDLKEIQSLIAVCASALRDTGSCEDASVVDVLLMTSNRLWGLTESEAIEIEALELSIAEDA